MTHLDYCIVAVYLLAIVFVGFWLQKKASAGIDSFFLGNRSIPWWVLGASGMASNLDVTGTMINTALLFSLGISGFFVEIRGGVVLVLAFLMTFMGKWNRRAGVMTLAEWMHLRFGDRKDGEVARVVTVLATLLVTISMIIYFCKGAGYFVAEFLSIPGFWGFPPEFWAAMLMIFLAMIYTVASGFVGVVWTDVFQSVLIFTTIIIICFIAFTKYDLPERFNLSVPVNVEKLEAYNSSHDVKLTPGSKVGDNSEYTLREVRGKLFLVWETSKAEWSRIIPPRRFNFPDISYYSIFNLISLALMFYLFKTSLSGMSMGSSGYMVQRYFAARSDRDAGLLTVFWAFLLSFRWPFIVAIAVMGISLGAGSGIGDPEMVLPVVVNTIIPTGLKGLLVAGLMAAAMSSFDSTINSASAYWVKDIYQAYLKPHASERELLIQGRLASVIIVALGLGLSLTIKNINEVWGWITMGLTGGMVAPMFLRWYWWRLNGWGFAIGAAAGNIIAIIAMLALPDGTPEFALFLLVFVISLAATIIGTLLTKPPEEEVLLNFYRKIRPFGFWSHIREKLPHEKVVKINSENRRDIFSTFLAVPWQLSLFLMWMMVILKRWDQFVVLLSLLIVFSIALYFSWYRHLYDDIETDEM